MVGFGVKHSAMASSHGFSQYEVSRHIDQSNSTIKSTYPQLYTTGNKHLGATRLNLGDFRVILMLNVVVLKATKLLPVGIKCEEIITAIDQAH